MVLAHGIPIGFGEAAAIAAGAIVWTVSLLTYHRGWRRSTSRERWPLVAFAVGSGAAIAAATPPIEHLAGDLVSMHMVQHVMLLLVAGPAIAVSRPIETLLRGMSRPTRKRIGRWRRNTRLTPSNTSHLARPMIVWLLYALALWFWHGSGPYEMAAQNLGVHILEHVIFLGVALAFWSIVLSSRKVSVGFRILMVFTTAFHSVLLGALLTFSYDVWYPSYIERTVAVGLDPLADQRLAGLLMWIPGGLAYSGAGLWLLTSWLGGQPGVAAAPTPVAESE